SPILRSFSISPWAYLGATASTFAAGGAGQVGPITEGMKRNRYGVFAGLRERRVVAGAEWAQRVDEGSESGLNTIASPRAVRDSTGRVLDAFFIGRTVEWFSANKRSNLSVIARFDHFTPSTDPQGPNYAGTTPSYNFWIAGLGYDLNQRITAALNWQVQ